MRPKMGKIRGQLSAEDEAKLSPELLASQERIAKERKRLMSPAKKLKLPKLLEARRQEFGITDGAFEMQPFHDRVLIYQVREAEETYGQGLILKTDAAREGENHSCPKGVIVAAGPRALDELRCNGIDLGHIVVFLRMAPWRIETDTVNGRAEKVIVLRSGDVVGSLDLAENLRSGDMKVVFDEKKFEHWYQTKDKKAWKPRDVEPFVPEDM
jgi:co-chaperonin GroES (HSP10)